MGGPAARGGEAPDVPKKCLRARNIPIPIDLARGSKNQMEGAKRAEPPRRSRFQGTNTKKGCADARLANFQRKLRGNEKRIRRIERPGRGDEVGPSMWGIHFQGGRREAASFCGQQRHDQPERPWRDLRDFRGLRDPIGRSGSLFGGPEEKRLPRSLILGRFQEASCV